MYGESRVLTCDECGVTGPDVNPVTEDGERRTLCRTHNNELLRGDPDREESDPDRSDDGLEEVALDDDLTEQPVDEDRVDDLLDLFRLQTLKRGQDSWEFGLEDVARDLRVDEADARVLIKAARNRQSPFGVFSNPNPEDGYVVSVGGEASV
jgi:hypothetical protein